MKVLHEEETMAQEEHHHAEEFLKLLFRGLMPLVFFVGGIVVLVSRIQGWSLLLGLPMTIFGAAILIYTFDDIARATILPLPHVTKCSVCGKPTPVLPGVSEKDSICYSCKRDIKKGIKKETF